MAALSFEAIDADQAVLDARVHAARPIPGQVAVAARMRALLAGTPSPRRGRGVHDPLSFRSQPQVDGAVHDALDALDRVLAVELNAAAENPLLVAAPEPDVLASGNFHAVALALALDGLRAALAQAASIVAARASALLDDRFSGLRGWLAGPAEASSGAMAVEYTAHAAAAEVRLLAAPAAAQHTVVGAGMESHASFAALSVLQTDRALDAYATRSPPSSCSPPVRCAWRAARRAARAPARSSRPPPRACPRGSRTARSRTASAVRGPCSAPDSQTPAARRALACAASSKASSSGASGASSAERRRDQPVGEPRVLRQQRAVQVGADDGPADHALDAGRARVAVARAARGPSGCSAAPRYVRPPWFSNPASTRGPSRPGSSTSIATLPISRGPSSRTVRRSTSPMPGHLLVAELVGVAEQLVAAADGEDRAAVGGRGVQRVALARRRGPARRAAGRGPGRRRGRRGRGHRGSTSSPRLAGWTSKPIPRHAQRRSSSRMLPRSA